MGDSLQNTRNLLFLSVWVSASGASFRTPATEWSQPRYKIRYGAGVNPLSLIYCLPWNNNIRPCRCGHFLRRVVMTITSGSINLLPRADLLHLAEGLQLWTQTKAKVTIVAVLVFIPNWTASAVFTPDLSWQSLVFKPTKLVTSLQPSRQLRISCFVQGHSWSLEAVSCLRTFKEIKASCTLKNEQSHDRYEKKGRGISRIRLMMGIQENNNNKSQNVCPYFWSVDVVHKHEETIVWLMELKMLTSYKCENCLHLQ